MSSVLRDMTLADLRNMLIIKISHKENNFPNFIRNSYHGICTLET